MPSLNTITWPWRQLLTGPVGTVSPSVIAYLINDTFTTPLTAGNVDGTAAEPGPGTRSVVDTGNLVSISGGDLVYASGGSSDDPRVSYSDPFTRTAGQLVKHALQGSDIAASRFGWDNALAGAPTNLSFDTGANLLAYEDDTGVIVGVGLSNDTPYEAVVIQRAAGGYWFVKGGAYTDWTLVYIGSASVAATLYAVAQANGATTHYSRIVVPKPLYLPSPSFYDSFGRADGAPGSTESTGPDGQPAPVRTWEGNGSIVSNKLQVSPELGAELLTNGDFADWTGDDPDGWTVSAELANREVTEVGTTEGHGGSGTGSANFWNSGSSSYQPSISQIILEGGAWYSVTGVISRKSGFGLQLNLNTKLYNATSATTHTFTNSAGGPSFIVRTFSTQPHDSTIDSVSVKQLNLSTCIAAVDDTSSEDVFVAADFTAADNTQFGYMLRLDDSDNPNNYLHVYCNRVDNLIYVDEVSAGVVTNLSSTAFTYSAGATLKVQLLGTAQRVYYNDTFIVASTNTVAGNTKTAVFATDPDTTIDNFVQFPTTGYRRLGDF